VNGPRDTDKTAPPADTSGPRSPSAEAWTDLPTRELEEKQRVLHSLIRDDSLSERTREAEIVELGFIERELARRA